MGALIDVFDPIWSWCDAQVKVLPGKGDKVLVTGHVCFTTGTVSGVVGRALVACQAGSTADVVVLESWASGRVKVSS